MFVKSHKPWIQHNLDQRLIDKNINFTVEVDKTPIKFNTFEIEVEKCVELIHKKYLNLS